MGVRIVHLAVIRERSKLYRIIGPDKLAQILDALADAGFERPLWRQAGTGKTPDWRAYLPRVKKRGIGLTAEKHHPRSIRHWQKEEAMKSCRSAQHPCTSLGRRRIAIVITKVTKYAGISVAEPGKCGIGNQRACRGV